VISTRTRVLPACKVQFPPAQYDFTRKVWFPHKSVFWHLRLWLGHARVWFIHAECNFNTHSRIFTRRVWFYTQSKFDTYACEKDTHEYDIYTLRVWFLHAECNFYTQCDFDKHQGDFNTHECDFNTQCVILHAECGFHSHKSSFDTYACNLYKFPHAVWYSVIRSVILRYSNDTHDCGFNTHKSDLNTQSVILTRMRV
jgi:hypothetical protein